MFGVRALTMRTSGASVPPRAMNQHDFETALMRMWTTTRIPLTRVHMQVYTNAPRDRIEKWVNELAAAGIVELDSDAEGEALWRVRGAARSTTGPRTIDELERLGRLAREVDGEAARASATRASAKPVHLAARIADEPSVHDEKSLIASGALSFVFGPIGWLYAAPLKDAVPAIVAVALVSSLLPMTLAASILGVVAPVSAVAGVLYAYRYNKTGRRASLMELVAETRAKLPRGR